MPYGWHENAEREGGGDFIPPGRHEVQIIRVVAGGFSSNKNPQTVVTFQDTQAREISLWLTLTEKAAWVLAKLLKACGLNLKALEADGVEPIAFHDQEFAEAQLLRRRLFIDVKTKDNGKSEVMPCTDASVLPTPAPAAAEPPPADDDGPPSDDPPAPEYDEKSAWAEVMRQWSGNADPGAKERRNEAWRKAMKKIGKDKANLTGADWAKVVAEASIPF